MTYDETLKLADGEGLSVKEKTLKGSDGRILGKRIAIRKDIETTIEKSCVLAEEIGHYNTTSGDIVRISNDYEQKQEHRARLYGYNLKVGLMGIIDAFEAGCRSAHEVAEHLDVTEKYFLEAIECYRGKYGRSVSVDNYIIIFEPMLVITRGIELTASAFN